MKQVTINLYTFSELGENAKDKAIMEHSDFLDTLEPLEDYGNDNSITEEKSQYTRDEVIENIEANEYLFYQDGTLAHCTTYTGKHAKAGLTEFQVHGEVFPVN